MSIFFSANIYAQTQPDFHWGNGSYFNIGIGDSITFRDIEVKLLEQNNIFNQLKIGNDTIWIKVSRRTLPVNVGGLRIFVADNKNVKALTDDPEVHGLLKKDALICVSDFKQPLLNQNNYIFPISFNDGFLWSVEESSTMFSYEGKVDGKYLSYPGVAFDLNDACGIEKHWIVALEKSTVIWVKNENLNDSEIAACVLLESSSQPGIYYVYSHLFDKNIIVKKGDQLVRGELIGTIWGDYNWGHLQFSVIKSDTVPTFDTKFFNAVNCFPQLYELYFKQTYSFSRNYTKGKLSFGRRCNINGNKKNIIAFEEYLGKGWKLDDWNVTDRVEWISKGDKGNARLRKILFRKEKASCINPDNYYDFEINVRNGVYRIRANIGDLELASWQKVQFEGVTAATYSLDAGEFKWTSEKVVKVKDGKLTIRIFVDESNKKVAGISEIVFQKAY
ncbi:MAG: M23 family metallopeptidase [Draconibacterium sp.]|nr:M23 family metallopeptidase [Draconibacterium sp.]